MVELRVTSPQDRPDVLINARIAAGLTQRQLAAGLEVREQQV